MSGPAKASGDVAALDAQAIAWLLASDEPGIRLQTRRDLLGDDVAWDTDEILSGPKARSLLEAQQPDGTFGVHAYSKWMGAHWRLVSLVELGISVGEPRALAAYETVLRWLFGPGHRRVPLIEGRYRRCASQEGNALAVGARLGLADDDRVRQLAQSLIEWQWPQGGWNCDREPEVTHPSVHETITPLWGLAEFSSATGDSTARAAAREAADRTAEFFLDHRVFRSHTTGEVGDARWLDLHWPPYWAYDFAWGLTVLSRAGALPDVRADEAVTLLRERQHSDGTWWTDRRWTNFSDRDPIAGPSRAPSELLTLNALRVLRVAG
jgi:hypothetical protein